MGTRLDLRLDAPGRDDSPRDPEARPNGAAVGDWTRLPPGVLPSCLVLTGLSVTLAVGAEDTRTSAIVGALFAAMLCGFFHALGRRHPELRSLPLRLIECGFGLVTLGATAGALESTLTARPGDSLLWVTVVHACGQGLGLPILGASLVGFGIVSWVPLLVDGHRQLQDRYRSVRGALQSSERIRDKMESRIAEADRLRTTGQLALGVAHDLRNPLAICRAAAESLERAPSPREGAAARHSASVQEHAQVILRNVDRSERTIAALLALGRPTATQAEPAPQDVRALLGSVAGLAEYEAKRRGARLVVDADPALRGRLPTEPCQRLLLNLVHNALQANAREVSIHARVLQGRHLLLCIADRGDGLAPEVRAHLFEPFFTTRSDGVGLGLLSCRRVVSDLGGTIRLYPRLRGGTRAIVLLPLGIENAPAPRLRPTVASGRSRTGAR